MADENAVSGRSAAGGHVKKRYPAALLGVAALAASMIWVMAEPKPREDVVLRLEQLLRADDCAAPALRGKRVYYFARDERGRTDRSVVRFSLLGGRPSERLITGPSGDSVIDDMQQRYARGRYDMHSGRLTMDYCGLNYPET